MPRRLKELGIDNISDEWKKIINLEGLIDNYVLDFKWMMDNIEESVEEWVLNLYGNIVFENGQGLLLDQNIQGYGVHTTPSNTGIKNPLEIINSVFKEDEYNLEVCYVTRSYMTRHGVGRFDTECRKEDINPDMIDLTNVPNPHQGILRYGWLDLNDLVKRVKEDICKVECMVSLAITHQNEYRVDVDCNLRNEFYCIYESDGLDRESIYTKGKNK